jgi:hypothetical protein
LSRAVLDPEDWSAFYASLGDIEVPALGGLTWDGNEIDRSNVGVFRSFILHQPHLSELSLAEALTPDALPLLESLSSLTQLTSLSIACRRHESLGKPLIAPLLTIVRNNPIEAIDVTGQEIGEETLLQIIEAAPGLRELRFRYFAASSGDALIRVCQRILQSPTISFATFPSKDVQPAMLKSNVARRAEIVREVGLLRQRFAERFGKEADSAEDGEETRLLTGAPQTVRPPKARALPRGEDRRTIIAQNLETMKFFADYDQETLGFIGECGELSGVDPMWRAYVEAMNAIEIPNLARALRV